jgi:diguanylate cyclase (GGDEF)-like protein
MDKSSGQEKPPARVAPVNASELISTPGLTNILDSIAAAICVWDADLCLVTWNRAFLKILALPSELVRPGMRLAEVLDLCPPLLNDDRTGEQLEAFGRLKLATDGRLLLERVQADGRTISVNYDAFFSGGWIALYHDVSERQQSARLLRERDAEVAHDKIRLEAAVNNMSQGLCMFDGERRLVICNMQYAKIYDLPAELVKPGTSLEEILAERLRHGLYPVGGADAYFQRRLDLAAKKEDDVDIVELQDGRVLSILHHPMPGGGWVSTHEDITEQRRNEARIRYLAGNDALTDLPNRATFRDAMDAADQRIKRRDKLCVFAIDLDHFKSVNDTSGHGVGDAILKMVASRLRTSCREGDVVARLGGDEFAVLTEPLLLPQDAAALADRIVTAMAEPFEIDGRSVLIGASVGIAVAPGDGSTAEVLLRKADLALYRAKREGRGAYHFFEKGMDAILQERRSLELALGQAVVRREFRLVFQPLFNLAEGKICALEALLRWESPVRGSVPPSEFIPIAEETGLIVTIGEWVLREACKAATAWPEHIRISVNLSTVQFRNRNLFQFIESVLAETGLKPGRLELEVTESLLLIDSEATLRTLHQLRQLGVRISMDDFGTGYSSLSYLRSFPALGMTSTAEGVETEAQLDLVRSEGCTEVQGFLFSPPLLGSAIDRLFAESGGQLDRWARTLAKSA